MGGDESLIYCYCSKALPAEGTAQLHCCSKRPFCSVQEWLVSYVPRGSMRVSSNDSVVSSLNSNMHWCARLSHL